MTPQQIDAVRNTWALVLPIKDRAGELFYGRLFELAPQVRSLFTGDMKRQSAMLMATLGGVVQSLDRLDLLLPTARQLALRHVGYGARPEHYDVVGEALLWTLRQGLAGSVDEDTLEDAMQAWGTAYVSLAGAMKAAAYPPPVFEQQLENHSA